MTTEIIASDVSDTFDKDEMHTLLAMVGAGEGGVRWAKGEQQSLSKQERERARARAKTKRFYHRRANMLRGLREEVVELESKLQLLTSSSQASLMDDKARSCSPELTDFPDTRDQLGQESLQQLLRGLAVARARLNEENVALRALFQQSSHKLQHVRDLLLAVDDKLFMIDRSSFALLRPLTLADCLKIRQRALDEFRTFAANERYVKPQGTTYGWQERRIIEHDAIKFAMTKTIYHHTAESIFQRTWRMLTDPAGMAQFYSNTLNFKCNVVQKVDENNFVWYLESRLVSSAESVEDFDDAKPVIVKSVVLISRFLTQNGQFILIRGLSREYFEIFDTPGDGVMEVWTDMLAWIQSRPTGPNGEHCQSSYAGITPTGGADPKFWLAEIALHVLRWEAAALGTRFSLPSE